MPAYKTGKLTQQSSVPQKHLVTLVAARNRDQNREDRLSRRPKRPVAPAPSGRMALLGRYPTVKEACDDRPPFEAPQPMIPLTLKSRAAWS